MATYDRPTGTLHRVRIGVGLAAAGALLAACGSSSKGAATSPGTTTSTGSSAASTAPTAPASSKDSGKSGSTNLGGGSFCDKAKKASANVSDAAKSLTVDTPDKIKEFEQNAIDELTALRNQAPSEIKGAVSTLVDAETTLFNELKSADFDFTKAGSQVASAFSAPQFTQAIQQIGTYLTTKCGIDPSAFATS